MKSIFKLTMYFLMVSLHSPIFAQAPNLGTATNFVLFTTVGAVGSTGLSDVTGDVGSNAGAITGFTVITGVVHNADLVTAQAATDLLFAYTQIYNTPATVTAHIPVFGGGETLFPGVYSISAAASLAGSLTLDAQGNPNAIFIFKIGGALTTGAATTVHLLNGTQINNIFWMAEGAISMAASTRIMGTFIAHTGAIDMGDGSTLEGRLLSTTRAVSIYGTHAIIPSPGILALSLSSFNGSCVGGYLQLQWTSATHNNEQFTAEGSSDEIHWSVIEKTESNSLINRYSIVQSPDGNDMKYYRLFKRDASGKKQYGNIIQVQPCAVNHPEKLIVSPNPSLGHIHLVLPPNTNGVISTDVYDFSGREIYKTKGLSSNLDLSQYTNGEYIVSIKLRSGIINQKIILSK